MFSWFRTIWHLMLSFFHALFVRFLIAQLQQKQLMQTRHQWPCVLLCCYVACYILIIVVSVFPFSVRISWYVCYGLIDITKIVGVGCSLFSFSFSFSFYFSVLFLFVFVHCPKCVATKQNKKNNKSKNHVFVIRTLLDQSMYRTWQSVFICSYSHNANPNTNMYDVYNVYEGQPLIPLKVIFTKLNIFIDRHTVLFLLLTDYMNIQLFGIDH